MSRLWPIPKVQLALGSAILALLVVGGLSLRAIAVSRESEHRARHTQLVLDSLQDLISSMGLIESNSRGFVLSGDASFLESYDASLASVARDTAAIRDLTKDNSRQQLRLPAFEKLVDQKLKFAARVIGLRRDKGFDAAVEMVRGGFGKRLMDEFQAIVRQLRLEELRLLALRNADSDRRLSEARTSLILGIVLGPLIAGFAGWSVHRDSARRRRAEGAMRESEERFRMLTDNISQMAWITDEKGTPTWFNRRWFDYTGSISHGGADPTSRQLIHPDHSQRVTDKITRACRDGEAWEDTFPMRGADGEYHWFLTRAVPTRDADGKRLRWFGTNTDISERLEIEDALFAEKERAQVTLDSIGDAVACTDILGNVTFLNQVAEAMTGWSCEEAIGRPMADIIRIHHAATREVIPNPMEMAIALNKSVHLPPDCILVRRDGFETPIEDSVAPIHDRAGQATGAVIVFRDVTAALAMALKMAHSAEHDFLTGLPNRLLLSDRGRQAIALAGRHGKKIAVLFLDLDGFKHINDSLGHSVGDKLLQSVAHRLVGCVRAADTVSRQGGDEFVILLSEVEQSEDAAISARRILQAVAAIHAIDEHELHITTSIGVSIYPDDGHDAETLIKNADTAMYRAKENDRNGFKFFTPEMNDRAVERQSVEEDLRRALERREFALHYQPIVDLKSGLITGAEALIRWTHPTRGPLAPDQFIHVAEDSGLILPIGNWVLREACRQARAWMDAGLPLALIAVNISAMEFRSETFLEGVLAALDDSGLDPGSLELELTERALMKQAEATEPLLRALREKGVKLAVDDFGTGYSSLSYLQNFSIDALKIDQSFVRQISIAPEATGLVSAVISIGRSLGLRVVAEGVETADEMAFLQARHCDQAQGYYFSRPLPPGQFAELLGRGLGKGTAVADRDATAQPAATRARAATTRLAS